jgi:hypothetical protein
MTSLTTAAPLLAEAPQFIPTGNLEVSLAMIDKRDAGIYSIGALMMKSAGLIEVSGDEAERKPLLVPYLVQNGQPLELGYLVWERLGGWAPRFAARAGDLAVRGTIFCPPGEKGFVYLLELRAGAAEADLAAGVQGWWQSVDYAVFKRRRLEASLSLAYDPWTRSLVGEGRVGVPLVAWGLQAPFDDSPVVEGMHFRWSREVRLAAGESLTLAFYGSMNLESDGARTGALGMRRRGAQALLDETLDWLAAHRLSLPDPELERILNENLFFNYFYAQGNCLDTGELVLITSRSTAYYVSAAYWARDALLWSFPALLLTDREQARAALQAAWTRYLPHAAEHALYINGQNLYPGFELDQACAPPIALGHYLHATGDWEFALRTTTPQALHRLEQGLRAHYSPVVGLYATFLTPHDDPTEFPFLTYNNVLVWRALDVLAELWGRLEDKGRAADLRREAKKLKQAIRSKCVVEGPFGAQFTGALDEAGRHALVDLPGASWSLFPFYGFCASDDPLYLNSMRWISSQHNPHFYPGRFGGAGAEHFPFPSSFDLANRLLRKDPSALASLRSLPMDQGLCCESFDPEAGVVRTGAAFASMAGFLAFCLYQAMKV